MKQYANITLFSHHTTLFVYDNYTPIQATVQSHKLYITNNIFHAICKFSPTLINIRANVVLQLCGIPNLGSTAKKKQVQGGTCNGTCQKIVVKCSNVEISVDKPLQIFMMCAI